MMALKQAKHQQVLHSRKHSSKAPKKTSSKANSINHDPWSFLEHIDAPQWVDLSEEADLMGKEGDDPWFYAGHLYHQISIAELVAKASQVHMGCKEVNHKREGFSVKQTVEAHLARSSSKGVNRSRGQLKNFGGGQCWPRSQAKRIQLQQESPSHEENIQRQLQESNIQEGNSSCSERFTVSKAGPVLSIDLNTSPNMLIETHFCSDEGETNPCTPPSSCDSHRIENQHKQEKNSSEAALQGHRPKTRFPYEICQSSSRQSISQPVSNDRDIRSDAPFLETTSSLIGFDKEDTSKLCESWEDASDICNLDTGRMEAQTEFRGFPSGKSVTAVVTIEGILQSQGARRVVKDDHTAEEQKRRIRGYLNIATKVESLKEKGSFHQRPSFLGYTAARQQFQAEDQSKILSSGQSVLQCSVWETTGNHKPVTKDPGNRVDPGVQEHGTFGDGTKESPRKEVSFTDDVQVNHPLCVFKVELDRSKKTDVRLHRPLNFNCHGKDTSECEELELAALVAKHNQKILSMLTQEPRRLSFKFTRRSARQSRS